MPIVEATTESDPRALLHTRVGGRYTLVGIQGRGGKGVVYAALDDATGHDVALKVLDEAWADDARAVERFFGEARLAMELKHDHIVEVTGLGELPDGRPYFVMPLIHGTDLATLLADEGPQPPARVAALLRGVASALDMIHARGLVHHDVKPENLMLVKRPDGSEYATMLDFGIARARFPDGRRGIELFDEGTPEFMPPEAATGVQPDHRGDVWSLAAVAFELMTGWLPFEFEDVEALARAKATQAPSTMAAASGRPFPLALEVVIARGLARLPADRFPSAGVFVERLAIASRGTPVEAGASARNRGSAAPVFPPPTRGHQPRKKRMRPLTLVAAGGIPQALRPPSVAPTATPSEPPEPAAVEAAPASEAAASAESGLRSLSGFASLADAERVPEAEPVPEAERVPEAEAESPAEAVAEPVAEPDAEPAAQAASVPEPEVGAAEVEPAPEPAAEPVLETGDDAAFASETSSHDGAVSPPVSSLPPPPAAGHGASAPPVAPPATQPGSVPPSRERITETSGTFLREDAFPPLTPGVGGVAAPPMLPAPSAIATAPSAAPPAPSFEVEAPAPFDAALLDDELSTMRERRVSLPVLAGITGVVIILLAVLIRMSADGGASSAGATTGDVPEAVAPVPQPSPASPTSPVEATAMAAEQAATGVTTPPPDGQTGTSTPVTAKPDVPVPSAAKRGQREQDAPALRVAPRRSERTAVAPRAARTEDAAKLVREATDAILRGDLEGGAALYKRAIAADRRNAAAWRGRGLALERLGKKREARAALKTALGLTPEGPAANKIRERLEALE